jgi:uncharacterized membrane protein
MELIFIVAIIALAFAVRSAHTKINTLENKLRQLNQSQVQSEMLPNVVTSTSLADQLVGQDSVGVESPTPIPDAGQSLGTDVQPAAVTPIPRPTPLYQEPVGPAQPFFLYTWFQDHTLIKIGSIIFFFGAAWFVSYAFEQNWIPPLVRVGMGLALAGIVYVVGYARRPVELSQYIVLTALGSGIVFATILAAQFSFVEPLLPALISLLFLLAAITYTLWVSFQTSTEWLAITATVAALFAPQFTGSDPASAVPFLTYLFVVAAGFGAVVLATAWRYVSLTLVVGVSMYLLSVSALPAQGPIVWFFAVLFCALFLGLTTGSVFRNRVPLFIDGVTLLITGLMFAYFVHTEALVPEIAAFAAAIVTALIGYVARLRSVDPSAVLLYAVISVVSIFAATAYLFNGFTATFFFAVESAALVFFAMQYAFLKRTILLASSTLLIPLVLGITALADSAWDTGILHAPALAVLAVSVCFGSIGVYMYVTAERTTLTWLTSLAQTTLFCWYGFTTISLVVLGRALATITTGDVLAWSLLLLLALSILITLVTFSRATVRCYTLWTYTIPLCAATGILLQSGSEGFFSSIDILLSSLMLIVLVAITTLFGLIAKTSQSEQDSLASYIFLWISFLFASAWVVILLGTFISAALTLTIGAIFVALMTYGIINGLLRLDVQFKRVASFVVALYVPAAGLIPAISLSGWSDGVLSIDAVSLYAYTTLVLLTGVTLYRYAEQRGNEQAKTLSSVLFIIGGLFSFVLVWVVTHTISSTAAIAVTAALFTYTILGLLSYVYGKRSGQKMFVQAGYLLLTAVVLRLGLIDVWNMDPFWRIITFLGIGALFIIAALLERKPEKPTIDNQ